MEEGQREKSYSTGRRRRRRRKTSPSAELRASEIHGRRDGEEEKEGNSGGFATC